MSTFRVKAADGGVVIRNTPRTPAVCSRSCFLLTSLIGVIICATLSFSCSGNCFSTATYQGEGKTKSLFSKWLFYLCEPSVWIPAGTEEMWLDMKPKLLSEGWTRSDPATSLSGLEIQTEIQNIKYLYGTNTKLHAYKVRRQSQHNIGLVGKKESVSISSDWFMKVVWLVHFHGFLSWRTARS